MTSLLLFSILHVFLLYSSLFDIKIWLLCPPGCFSTHCFFQALSEYKAWVSSSSVSFNWNSKGPPRIGVFAWFAANKRIDASDILCLRRSCKEISPVHCIICLGSDETVNNIFRHCFTVLFLDPPRSGINDVDFSK